jgi:hypothetical protein
VITAVTQFPSLGDRLREMADARAP